MKFVQTDGGREAAGFGKRARDCGVRAVAVAAQLPYAVVHADLWEANLDFTHHKAERAKASPTHGVYREAMRSYMASIGWTWHPLMRIGSGCRVHLRDGELPAGRLVVQVSRHYTAVIDGVLHDNHDCSRNGTRCVYGYYSLI